MYISTDFMKYSIISKVTCEHKLYLKFIKIKVILIPRPPLTEVIEGLVNSLYLNVIILRI